MEPKFFSHFLPLDYWLIWNNLQDLVTSTDIITAIKTNHRAISFQLTNSENSIRGPGYWKMNTSILDKDVQIKDVALLIPFWLNEGRNELTNNRSIWNWTKYNVIDHPIKYSIQRTKETIA